MKIREMMMQARWFVIDLYRVNLYYPIRELISQLTHDQSRLLVWRKKHYLVNLIYKMFHVPHGTCRYACRKCSMEIDLPVKASYIERFDMFGCLRCNQWLENPGPLGKPEGTPWIYAS